MESKKRAHSDEDEPTSVKKRILSGENGSPRLNGANAEDQATINAAELEVKTTIHIGILTLTATP